ncbi:hypothetical protein IFM51744_10092 [Aspergillus udagawae]|nr:hypothetical protein IFM51744_10092 [Aspergillus udagawae]
MPPAAIACRRSRAILIASASFDRTVKIWDAANGHYLQTLEGHSKLVNSAVFSHDSKLVASALTDGTVKIWDAASGHCLQKLKGNTGSVKSVAFSYDSKLVASASTDVTVKIWDAASGHCLQTVNAGGITRVKSFCRTNSYVELDRGTMRLSLVSLAIPAEHSSEAPAFRGCGISSDRAWITWDTANLLWLPHEYRPYTIDTTVSAISIGCKTGRVPVFKIDPRRLSDSITNP